MNLSRNFCECLQTVFRTPPVKWLCRQPNLGDRKDLDRYAEWEFNHAAASLLQFGEFGGIEGKSILDIGCGLGGKSTYYALHGAHRVVGIDSSSERLVVAHRLAKRHGSDNVLFENKDAADIQSDGIAFDMIVFNDSFEHLNQPEQVLKQCTTMLKPGGTVNIVFPPYKSPWGAHLFLFISIPWPQLLFKDETLLQAWRGYFYNALAENEGIFTDERVAMVANADSVPELCQLNGMTIRNFYRIVAGSGFKTRLLRLHPINPLLKWCTGIDRINEYLVDRVVAVLEKP